MVGIPSAEHLFFGVTGDRSGLTVDTFFSIGQVSKDVHLPVPIWQVANNQLVHIKNTLDKFATDILSGCMQLLHDEFNGFCDCSFLVGTLSNW
jgi:hypothetical protein